MVSIIFLKEEDDQVKIGKRGEIHWNCFFPADRENSFYYSGQHASFRNLSKDK
jgi:hypothetical protein